jgi:hydroxymethylpyrimidine pyrophosphatase-like HAD family hydrolase
MIARVFACDYDGTIADQGVLAPVTAAALERARESGRKLVLVTGRRLPDLESVCPGVHRMFDAIVVENGALLALPGNGELRPLGDPPSPTLLAALRDRGVPFEVGTSIVATSGEYAEAALAAVREAGEERTLIFNRTELMLLPGGVTKKTGLEAALAALGLSRHNTVGIGDAENDHAFLAACECAVAVGDAIAALKERADHVTRAPASAGVVEFVDEHLLDDLTALLPRLSRHAIDLGETATGGPVRLGAHTTSLLVVGPSASGKSTLTGALVEQLVDAERSVCLIDPEGDYQTLSELSRVLVLGGRAEQALPPPEELEQLLREPGRSLVLNLSAMTRSEKVEYGTVVLGVVAAVRAATGMPHWLVIDEAHHLLPAAGSPAARLLASLAGPLCLTTLAIGDLAPEVWPVVDAVASTDRGAFEDAVRALGRTPRAGDAPGPAGEAAPDGGELRSGEAVLAWLAGAEAAPVRFTVARRRVLHRRHVRKYAEGELPPERSFYFRGPGARLNLRAANVMRFVEIAEGVDEETFAHHLRNGDYATWIREAIKDPDLAEEVVALERDPAAPRVRASVLDAIRRRYTV